MKTFLKVIIFVVVLVLIAKSYSPAGGDVKALIDQIIEFDLNTKAVDDFHGMASFYGDEYVGRKTSNGEIFVQNKLTAAHKTLPFGTMVKVTNLNNQKQVTVKINDRGPFKRGRIIDLTKSAAMEIDMIAQGVIDVSLEIVK